MRAVATIIAYSFLLVFKRPSCHYLLTPLCLALYVIMGTRLNYPLFPAISECSAQPSSDQDSLPPRGAEAFLASFGVGLICCLFFFCLLGIAWVVFEVYTLIGLFAHTPSHSTSRDLCIVGTHETLTTHVLHIQTSLHR